MDLKISEMMRLQQELFELHKDKWSPIKPEYGRQFFLWMMEEMGEAIAIIKKKGDRAIMEEPIVRAAFCEEMSDVLMYYHDILLRYNITAEEISNAYQQKHDRNMKRDYAAENKKMLSADKSFTGK